MIARNGVILIDQIQAVRAEGVAVWNAVIEAATSRFRPIMLGDIDGARHDPASTRSLADDGRERDARSAEAI